MPGFGGTGNAGLIPIKANGAGAVKIAADNDLPGETPMTSTQARWPIVSTLIEWLRPSPYERDLDFLEKNRGEEMDRLRAHVRGRPEDLRWLVGREPGSTEMLGHMMQVVGVDDHKVPDRARRDLERTCSRCEAKFHCADEIGHGRAAKTFEEFCPNAFALEALQRKGGK